MTSDGRQLPDWIDAWMEYTEESESPKSFHLWAAISTIAACLQRKCYLQWGALTRYPNMYIVLVAPSGRCRKGTAMDPTRELLDALNIKLAAEATTRESLVRELKKANHSTFDPATSNQMFHSSLTIHSQELTVFLGYDNKQLMSDLTDWYDCRNRWTYRTKTQGEDDIVGVWVNLFGATTPELVQSTMPMDAIGGGLTSRMIFVFEREKYKTSVFPSFPRELGELLLADLEKIHLMAGKFKVTSGFVDLWGEWYPYQDQNPPFQDARLAGYVQRRATHVMKLSIILSAARTDSMEINEHDLARAVRILESTEVRMPQVFRGMGSGSISNLVNKIGGYIGLNKRVSEATLQAAFVDDADYFTLSRVLETLEKMQYIKIIVRQGQPREIVLTDIGEGEYGREDVNTGAVGCWENNGRGPGGSEG